tara:strand:- start:5370 stop:6455 length:1086 start_codon:yes stop_codon:yes gene_type:complete
MQINNKNTRIAASFEIPFIQYLDQEGISKTKLPEFTSDKDFLTSLYRNMLVARQFDKKAISLQRTGKMGTYPSVLGQEAICVAIGAALDKQDVFLPYYRDIGTMFMRGVKMEEVLAYWGGDERGSDYQNPNVKHDFPFCVPIAGQCLHAAGIAAAMKYKGENNCVLVSLGDGGTSKGDFYEAINVAGTWKLPLITVIYNNQWAISVPRKLQTATETLAQKGIAAGIESIQVDGNDIIAMYDVLSYSIKQAKKHKPVLIEAISYRIGDHTTADDASRYRSTKELDTAKAKDPVLRLKLFLENNNLWDDDLDNNLITEIKTEVNHAVDNYLNTEKQSPTTLFDYLYQDLPDAYQDQYNELKNL